MNRICKAGLALWMALVLALGAGIPVSAAETELDGLLKSTAAGKKEYTCTLSVRCDTILDNLDKLDSKKKDLAPSEGVIEWVYTCDLGRDVGAEVTEREDGE